MTLKVWCETCGGDGTKYGERCSRCGGSGSFAERDPHAKREDDPPIEVQCGVCCGRGRMPDFMCPDCEGLGYTLRECIEVGNGKAVVVDARAIDRVAQLVARDDSLADPWDAMPEDSRDGFRESARALLRAFYGERGVYEAKAVGPAVVVGICSIAHRTETVEPGDLVAVGLKEVGK